MEIANSKRKNRKYQIGITAETANVVVCSEVMKWRACWP
jgi:hypothetical protein